MPGNITQQLPNAGSNQVQFAQLVPSIVKLAKTKATVTTLAATDITLNAATSLIEVNVGNATSLVGVYLRWQATASSTNWDEYVLPGTRHYAKPTDVTVVSLIADGADCEVRFVEK